MKFSRFFKHPVFTSIAIGIVVGAGAPPSIPIWAKFFIPKTTYSDVDHRGYDVQADFSTVVKNVRWDRLKVASLDFENWKKMGATGVNEMIIVERYSTDHLLVWVHMSASGASSKHFYDVWVFDEISGPGTFGNTFQLVHPTKTYKDSKGRTLPDSPAFSFMQGSWYLQSRPGNEAAIRYFVDATVASGIPSFLVGPIASRSMARSIRDLIEALAKSAQVR
ncbi:MAG: hypothetical protein JNL01_08560 [Bdellovibrionales bacterium]|nr:hypothetical protein [Bdellovibrionales bacterium]